MRPGRLSVVAGLTVCAVGGFAGESRRPTEHTVVIEAMRYEPEVLSIAAGDSVTWVNKDVVPHTATSAAAGFDSQAIQSDGSWTHTLHEKGEFPYFCTFHPAMTAKIVVE